MLQLFVRITKTWLWRSRNYYAYFLLHSCTLQKFHRCLKMSESEKGDNLEECDAVHWAAHGCRFLLMQFEGMSRRELSTGRFWRHLGRIANKNRVRILWKVPISSLSVNFQPNRFTCVWLKHRTLWLPRSTISLGHLWFFFIDLPFIGGKQRGDEILYCGGHSNGKRCILMLSEVLLDSGIFLLFSMVSCMSIWKKLKMVCRLILTT